MPLLSLPDDCLGEVCSFLSVRDLSLSRRATCKVLASVVRDAAVREDITAWCVAAIVSSALLLLVYSALPDVRRTPGWQFLFSSICEIYVAVGFLVLSLDELSERPQATMDRVFTFIDLPSITIQAVVKNATSNKAPPTVMAAVNGEGKTQVVSSKLSSELEIELRRDYKESNVRLADLYGVEAARSWNDKLTKLEITRGLTVGGSRP